jgi:hypothetical protein
VQICIHTVTGEGVHRASSTQDPDVATTIWKVDSMVLVEPGTLAESHTLKLDLLERDANSGSLKHARRPVGIATCEKSKEKLN